MKTKQDWLDDVVFEMGSCHHSAIHADSLERWLKILRMIQSDVGDVVYVNITGKEIDFQVDKR